MFYIFVSRRFGLAVPISIFLVGFLIEVIVDKNRGNGYFSSHMWPFGLVLIITGMITGSISCFVNPPPHKSSSMGYSSLLDLEEPFQDKIESVGTNVKDSLDHFLTESDEDDMFCYIPLNRCSLILTVAGIAFVGLDMIISSN